MMQRSSLETQKLELLNEISTLKLRQAAFERDTLELHSHDRDAKLSHQVEHLKAQVSCKSLAKILLFLKICLNFAFYCYVCFLNYFLYCLLFIKFNHYIFEFFFYIMHKNYLVNFP